MSSISLWVTVLSASTAILWLLLDIVLLIVASTVVRKRSIESCVALCVASLLQMCCTLGSSLVGIFAVRMGSSAMEGAAISTTGHVVLSLGRMLAFALIVYSIVRLSKLVAPHNHLPSLEG